MPYIKEPYGVNFIVENNPVTAEDKKLISGIIAHYKTTGKIKRIKDSTKAPAAKKHYSKPRSKNTSI